MKSEELRALIPDVIRAARAAGDLLTGYFQHIETRQIGTKSSPVDLVSIADQESEALLRKSLPNILPGAGFIGEESERIASQSEFHWVVDPLDGTSNYLAGVAIWAVSIALCDEALQPLLGVVHAPLIGRTWHAWRGGGAWLGEQRLNVRREPPGGGLHNAMLATGFPYDLDSVPGQRNITYFCQMQRTFHKIRRLGSAAIDLAFVADGTFDGMWELALSPWDTAAGCLLIAEAGGLFQRINGKPYTPGHPDVLAAATPELLAAMKLNLRSASSCPLVSGNSTR